MMDGCDTLLMVGTSFPYSEWLPEPARRRRADRHRRAHARNPPRQREQPRRRRARDAAPAAGAASAQAGPLVPAEIADGVARWWRILDERPALIDAIPDPEVPPLPPHIHAEHAKGFARA